MSLSRKDDSLDPLPDQPTKLNKAFFTDLINRIESIFPKEKEGGRRKGGQKPIITVTPSKGLGTIIDIDAEKITLTVCSNGVPAEIVVLGVGKNQ